MTGPVRQHDRPSRVVGPVVLLALFVGAWHYMHRWGMRQLFDKSGLVLPAPETVIDESFLDASGRANMLTGLRWTSLVALGGLAISIVLGVSLAVLMAQSRTIERAVYPYLVALQAVPILSIVPLIYVALGPGLGSRFLVCVLISIVPVVITTLFGLTSVDRSYHDLFALHHASRWTRLAKLQLPAALPSMFAGFRIAAGLCVVGAVVGEQFFRGGSKPGIGVVMERYRQRGSFPQVYGGVLLAAALGIAVYALLQVLERRVIGRWHEPVRARS